jgi:anti-sigma regulatory factor (Ser/Thr protein kinase)
MIDNAMASTTTPLKSDHPVVSAGAKFRAVPSPQNSTSENALRMLSETAHDVRAPLASAIESVRLVHDGELGLISAEQREFLASAIDQCHCIDHMIGEMVQVERLRSGVPRIRRQWINLAAIRHGIEETLHAWTTPRRIRLVWDINASHDATVFGDLSMIQRLVVNLVANAVRETPEGDSILIGVHKVASSDSLQWSVVDRGRGMTEAEMRSLSARQASNSGGEGLGLSICRQLAALHFSPLRIESRAGTGTAVSFRTPSGGPASVAERWSKWRVNQREPLRTPVSRHDKQIVLSGPSISNTDHVRVDAPSVTIQLESEGVQPKVDDRVAAGTVTLGAAMPSNVAESFDQLLQHRASMFDMIYRADTRTWVWMFDANTKMAESLIDEINEEAAKKIPSIRLSWTDPQSIPLDGVRTVTRVTEMLIRNSLATPSLQPEAERHAEDMPHSETAEQRLDEELRRLSTRLTRQSSQLHGQARRIRPAF